MNLKTSRGLAAAIGALLVAGTMVVVPAAQAAAPTSGTVATKASAAKAGRTDSITQESAKKVQQKLNDLGYPKLQTVDGVIGNFTKNALCAWRETIGGRLAASRAPLTRTERNQILNQTKLPVPKSYMVTGLNVDKRCQTLFWVAERPNGNRYYRAIFPVSTGNPGDSSLVPESYNRSGRTDFHTVSYQGNVQRWEDAMHIARDEMNAGTSDGYPSGCSDGHGNVTEAQRNACGNMYRPIFFNGGDAFHGRSIAYQNYIDWFPNSHGCARMLWKDLDKIWKAGLASTDTQVNVYSEWTTK